jgi:hypothetical protein
MRSAEVLSRGKWKSSHLSSLDLPLYSMPHLSLTMTSFPVRFAKKGLGFTMYYMYRKKVKEFAEHVVGGSIHDNFEDWVRILNVGRLTDITEKRP